jgi:ATP-dependent RNA helicase DeaD
MTTEFNQFNLHPQLVQAVEERGYTAPTPIQSGIIPLMLSGQDVLGQAQTGTGKTAAFALPILHNLLPDQKHVQALVLAPTRELANQVAGAMYEYGRHRDVRVLAVYGGQAYSRQITRLNKGVDIVVGTPGRLIDLMERKVLDISQVQTVVLDEADEMLSMGFIEDIETILKETPSQRQTALFSATLPQEIRRLADRYMHTPQSVTIQREQPAVAAIEQRYYLVNATDKLAALTRLFEVETIHSALIFARTRIGTGELANELTVRGFPAETLNGDLSQELRERVLNRFRQNQVKVLVATDVAARGLDIEDISHVFNFDLPEDEEIYVHRIGRTGRAGKSGIAISLITPQEQWRLRRIESFVRQKVTRCSLPSVEDIQRFRDMQLLEKMTIWLRRGRALRERALAVELVEAGYDPLEIAAAALKVARAEEKQRPIAAVSEVQEEAPRRARRESTRPIKREHGNFSHEAGMVRLSLAMGRRDGLRPNDVVSSIAYFAEIPGSVIGKISIQDQNTLLDVPEQFVKQVLAKSGNYRIRRQAATLEIA